MPVRCLSLIVTIVVGATRAAAQSDDHAIPSSASSSCLDSIRASAFTRVAVYGSVKFADSVSPATRVSAENILQDIVTRAQALLGAAPNVLPRGEPGVTWRGLSAPLAVTLYRDRRVARTVPAGRADTATAALLARALDSSLSEPLPFDWGADSLRDSVTFQIEVGWPSVDSAGRVTPPHFTSTAIPIFSVAHPWERSVAPKPGNRGPRYPDAARSAGYVAIVNMQFLVDTSGHAVSPSMRALWPDNVPPPEGEKREYYDLFVDAVRRAVPKMEFYPAVIGGCKTVQLVQMPFQFSLSR